MVHTIREMSSRRTLRLHLLIQGLFIGILVGFVISAYRIGISWLQGQIEHWLRLAHIDIHNGQWLKVITFMIGMIILGLLGGFIYKLSPLISGSGIPQVSAHLAGRLKPKWQSILPFKFIGGLLTLGSGLTLGREGPSVQIGASVGQGFADVFKRPNTERRYLVTGGASAGLAAAFNAPISGAVFALEELHRNFSPRALLCAMVAAFSAVITSGLLLGAQPVLHFDAVDHLPLDYYWMVLVVGVVTGLSGYIFCKGIVLAKKMYARLHLPWYLTGIIPFVIVGVVCLLSPELFGSGEHIIFYPKTDYVEPLWSLLILYIVKLCLLMLCFGSGLPGGIFFPLLVLGSLTGNMVGHVAAHFGLINPHYILALSLMAMAGHFSAIVRAPLTGILLVSEMTGSFSYMLPLGVVALIAYLMATLMKVEPIYETLQELLPLDDEDEPETVPTEERMLMEFVVEDYAQIDGKVIGEIQWPVDFLIVAIRRGSGEIAPNGNTRIQAGDYIIALFHRSHMHAIQRAMKVLTSSPYDVQMK